jgi:DNA repair photolyase
MLKIGTTERGDAALDIGWKRHVKDGWNGDPAILITKDPLKLWYQLNQDMNIIVHATITGLPKILEPNVPDKEESFIGLERIQKLIGRERTVLRVDPIICDEYDKAYAIIKEAIERDLVYRLRISFLDLYPHVKERFSSIGYQINQDFHADISIREELYNDIKAIFPDVEVCGEPGLSCSGCVSAKDLEILKQPIPFVSIEGNQRKYCKCLVEKKELLNNRHKCFHGCLYCYWKD